MQNPIAKQAETTRQKPIAKQAEITRQKPIAKHAETRESIASRLLE